jgi:hypothetical protein
MLLFKGDKSKLFTLSYKCKSGVLCAVPGREKEGGGLNQPHSSLKLAFDLALE